MNIKNKLVMLFMLVDYYGYAQIILTYDAAGNRITKQIAATIPVVNITGIDTACAGAILQLTANSSISSTTYVWNTGATNSTVAVLDDSTQMLSVIGLTSAGCKDTAYKQITAYPIPGIATILGDSMVLQGQIKSYKVAYDSGASYFWTVSSNNGIFIGGQGTDSVVIKWFGANTGTVTVVETTNHGCVGNMVSKAVEITPVGISETSLSSVFEVYPNPSDDVVQVFFKSEQHEGPYELTISDLTGKKIFGEKVAGEVMELKTENFGSSAGGYLLTIVNDKGKIGTKRIIRF